VEVVVSLQDVVNEMDGLSHGHEAFLNKRTGRLITLTEEEFSKAEDDIDVSDCPEWQRELIKEARQVISSDDCIPLPSKFEINEYHIMEEFCYDIEDQAIQNRLLNCISGRGAFRRFKDAIHLLDIQDDWFRFREREFEKIAVRWLEDHGIEYTRTADLRELRKERDESVDAPTKNLREIGKELDLE